MFVLDSSMNEFAKGLYFLQRLHSSFVELCYNSRVVSVSERVSKN